MKNSRFIYCILLSWLVFAIGCVTSTGHNPLKGWKGGETAKEGCPFDKTIITDYTDYIRHLPDEERTSVDQFNVRFYQNDSGQRAVEITIPINGIRWKHVLIYDKHDKRTKTIKYAASKYMS